MSRSSSCATGLEPARGRALVAHAEVEGLAVPYQRECGPDGVVTLDSLPLGSVALRVSAPSHLPRRFPVRVEPGPVRTIDVPLARAFAIRGRLEPFERSNATYVVRARRLDGVDAVVRFAAVAVDGTFALETLPPGSYELRASRSHGAPLLGDLAGAFVSIQDVDDAAPGAVLADALEHDVLGVVVPRPR